jgi:Zn finger protein HypA/HybF involved in hydrogenase expression
MANIFDISDEEFTELIKNSESRSDFFRKIGSLPRGAKFRTLNKRIEKLGLDISHFKSGADVTRLKIQLSKEEVLNRLVKDSFINTASLKTYIKRYDLLDEVCSRCGNEGFHFGDKLVLQLDHIDGDPSNNYLENLRFLCPNCHSQTDNYAGKKLKIRTFCKCGQEKDKVSKNCNKCKVDHRSVEWPPNEELERLLSENSLYRVSKIIGCSNNGLKQKCKRDKIGKFKIPSEGVEPSPQNSQF